jgi:hypothetical protein
MKEEQHQFLNVLGHPPARLTVEQVAWVLGCQVHDIPILIAARLIKPLGNPAHNAVKFFSTAEILEQAKDRSWLTKITNTVNQAWQKKNKRQQEKAVGRFSTSDNQSDAAAALTRHSL